MTMEKNVCQCAEIMNEYLMAAMFFAVQSGQGPPRHL